MIVSFRHSLIVLANPRCGSTSIRTALKEFADLTGSIRGGLHPHSCLRSVERHLQAAGEPNLNSFVVITTVRNPWDRVVSIYHYGLREPKSIWHRPSVEAGSFRAFCQHDVLDWVFRPKAGRDAINEGPFDIVNFTSDLFGRRVAEVFDMDQLAAVEARLRQIGINVSIPHLNKTERGGYVGYYDERSRDRVAYLFERDIEFMAYKFEGLTGSESDMATSLGQDDCVTT